MILFLVILGLSLMIGAFGTRTRLGFWGIFFASILFTPLVGLLLLIAAAPRTVHDDQPAP